MTQSDRAQSDRAQAFRALHHQDGAFVIPNPWDAGSARLLASVGFKALATTSAGFAFTLGRRDGAVSRDEKLQHIRDLVAAVDLPIAADLENGFGDAPEIAAETISLGAEAGLVGGSIEDSSGDPEHPIYDFNHAVERVAAAVEAAYALPFAFTLTARAENFLHGRPDLDDTIKRLQAFERAGADVLFAPGLTDLEMVKAICSSVSKPVNVVMSLALSKLTHADLAEAGVKRISLGAGLSRAAFGAVMRAAREITDHGSFTFLGDALQAAELIAVMKPD
jgi:2-methylisocitrate lyase-like PEP mutase family enzyme